MRGLWSCVRSSHRSQAVGIRLRTGGDDDPNAYTLALPIPSESFSRKSSVDVSCISPGHRRRTDRSIAEAAAALLRNLVPRLRSGSWPTAYCDELVVHLEPLILRPVQRSVQPDCAEESSSRQPSPSIRSNVPASAPHPFCPTVVDCRVEEAPSAR
jgi:hypothetical protein